MSTRKLQSTSKSRAIRTYAPISRPRQSVKRQNTRLSPLSPYMGTFNTIESLNEDVLQNTDDITSKDQQDMAQVIKSLYMKNKKNDDIFLKLFDTKFDFLQRFDLTGYNFQKNLVHPTTLINILTRFNNLKISEMSLTVDKPDLYKTYISTSMINYILTIFDTIGTKVLYLINYHNSLYLSPLNIRKFRDIIRKTVGIQTVTEDHIVKHNRDLRKLFRIDMNANKINIDAEKYDVIMMVSGFSSFLKTKNNITVKLSHFNYKSNHKASILDENDTDLDSANGHIISINKCNSHTLVNTTWKPFNIYTVESFVPGLENYYVIDKDNRLNEVSFQYLNKVFYYYSHFVKQEIMDDTFNNIHLFTSKGSPEYLQTLQEKSVCSDIYFPNNFSEFCWFSSVINSLFYADDISTSFLNKTVKHMDKTLEYIKDFYDTSYKTFDINDQQHLKEFSKHLIHLFAFVYCSFSILSKNQLNRVANKRKWKDIYDKITGEFYEYIYVFIIALSKTIKTN